MSVWVTLAMQVKDGQYEDLEPFLVEKLPLVRGFDGALSVTVYFETTTNEMLIVEEWKSKEHHTTYMAAISENGVLEQLASFMTALPTVTYYTRLAI